MSLENQLPVVGRSFYSFCKKCDADRYHTVLALPTDTTAKLQCEVCKAKSTWKAPKLKNSKTATAAPRGAAARAKAQSEAAKAASHLAEFETLAEAHSSAPESAYNMKLSFKKDTKLKHSKFGIGFIRSVQADKIEVVFQDEIRQLVHNRR